ncbi:MAG TPA: hypothetical protein PKW98_10825 [Candidatus Wallbacteria bacterium]|nr:MAG: hypothetical protein BWY32_01257 [bacterium ADurb.Bin243]HPG58297.1 hypothetical protein [Candidatus Wallbacteria bacterium]
MFNKINAVFIIALCFTSAGLFTACGGGVSAKMLPVSEVSRLARDFDEGKKNHKTAAAETLSLIKEMADSSGLEFIKARYGGEMNNPETLISAEFNFSTRDLNCFSNFIDETACGTHGFNLSASSFCVTSRKDPSHVSPDGRASKIYNITAVIKRFQSRAEVNKNLAAYSAIIKYCSLKYEISSVILSESNSQLSLSGSFSLKGTKKSFLEFLRGLRPDGVTGWTVSEKGFETRPHQIMIPFLAEIFFDK